MDEYWFFWCVAMGSVVASIIGVHIGAHSALKTHRDKMKILMEKLTKKGDRDYRTRNQQRPGGPLKL